MIIPMICLIVSMKVCVNLLSLQFKYVPNYSCKLIEIHLNILYLHGLLMKSINCLRSSSRYFRATTIGHRYSFQQDSIATIALQSNQNLLQHQTFAYQRNHLSSDYHSESFNCNRLTCSSLMLDTLIFSIQCVTRDQTSISV